MPMGLKGAPSTFQRLMSTVLSGIQGLKCLQPDKCEFLRKEVLYLEHHLTEGISHSQHHKKKLKGFLGFAGYCRCFIPNFIKIAKPLTNLLKNNTPVIWNATTNEAFNTLKQLLTSQPQFQYPDFSKPFILTTDASNEALGAVLSQGDIGRDLPVGYASRTISKAELNYPTVEEELLKIVWGCKYFMKYLLGRMFSVVTDHRPPSLDF
jgi:hypothetical protein